MNGDASNPHVKGVEGVLEAYMKTTQIVEMWGPTYFSPLIQQVNEQMEAIQADECQDNMKYTILLILTDGDVHKKDKRHTIREIIRASLLPVSFIIIGIGSPADDFAFMRELDADKNPLRARNGRGERVTQVRDCVQFLACNELRNDPELITRELLREIPEQITSYFDSRRL
jgi:hypothetical protein